VSRGANHWSPDQRAAEAERMRWEEPGFRDKQTPKTLPIDIPSRDRKAYNAAYYRLRRQTDPAFGYQPKRQQQSEQGD
jgi:hypothetical protein